MLPLPAPAAPPVVQAPPPPVEAVPVEGIDQLEAYASAPASDVALALHHSGGVRGKAVLDRVRKAGTREIAAQALKRADTAHILETGEIVRSGTGSDLAGDDSVKAAYLGGDV